MEKERRTKALLLSTLVVVVATLSIAFAAMSRVLNINGTAKMDTASWSVYFDNLSKANIVRGAEEVGKPSISTTDNGIIENINVKLSNPKDEISYTVDIVNDGTIDAEITMIKDVELTDVQKKVFEFSVFYTETGEKVSDGDTLLADTVKNITIKIRFKDDITEYDLPTESQTINLSYQLTYTQYDGGGAIVGPNGGEAVTDKPVLATVNVAEALTLSDPSTYHVFNGPIQRRVVESITFLNSDIVPAEYESSSWDASDKKDGSVMAWYEDSNSNGLKEVYIGGNGGVAAPADSSGLFAALVSLQQINFNNNFDTTNCVSMYGMFYYVMSIKTLDLSSFNTSNVTNMKAMFSVCNKLINLDTTNWDTSKVTDMSEMFCAADSYLDVGISMDIEVLNLSGWNTKNVETMKMMFRGCSKLTSLNLSGFDTSKVTNMHDMFVWCESLTSLDLSSFNTQNVTDIERMFCHCESLTSLDLSNWNLENVTDISSMFSSCSSLTELNMSNWNVPNLTVISDMFRECSSLTDLNMSNWNSLKVTDMSYMFRDCSSLTSVDLSNLNAPNLTDMGTMFYNCTSLISVDLSNFNASNVTDMSSMFSGCSSLINLDLSSFNPENVTDIVHMFYGCTSLEMVDLSGIDFGNVILDSKHGMFYGCYNLTVYVKDEESKEILIDGTPTATSAVTILVQPLSS